MSIDGGSGDGERQRLLPNAKPPLPGKSGYASTAPTPTPPAEDPAVEGKGSVNLLWYFILMLLMSLGNRIFGRLQVYPMHNYPLFLSLLCVAIYVPVCFAYIIPAMMFTDNITQEQKDIPKYKFAVMGAYDSLAGLLSAFAVNYITSSSTVVLVGQSAIPISMIVSSLTLGSKYTMAQYIGASVVMSGIVVVLIPNFMGHAQVDASGTAVDSNGQLIWIVVMVISCIPMCLSSVYKEKALGEMDVDCTYLNGWVAIFQFLIAIPLCIPSAQIQGLPISNIMPNMYGGWMCWLGINTITEDYNPYNQPLDNCASAPFFVTSYLFFNVVYNFLIVIILKYGSANILFLSSTVIVPISNVVFSLKFIPGSKPMGPMDLVGLVVILSGLVIYRFSNQMKELWESLNGLVVDPEELDKRMSARLVAKKIESKHAKYVGINAIEAVQTLMDTKVLNAQTQVLFRSPRVIRENYLLKLGVSPSPQLSVRGGRTGVIGSVTSSPAAPGRSSPFMSVSNRSGGSTGSGSGNANGNNNAKYPYLHQFPPNRTMSGGGGGPASLEEGRAHSAGPGYKSNNK